MTFDEYWKTAEKSLFSSLERALKQAAREAWEVARLEGEEVHDPVPYEQIVALYHEILPMGVRCKALTANRKSAIRARVRSGDLPDLDTWRQYFERAAKAKFIRGEVAPINGHKQFQVSIDYLIREDSYAKALENTGAFKW